MKMKFVLALTLVLGTLIAKAEEYRICPPNSTVMCGKAGIGTFCIDTDGKKLQMKPTGFSGTIPLTVKRENFQGSVPDAIHIQSEDWMTGSDTTKLNLNLMPIESPDKVKHYYEATINGEVNKLPIEEVVMPCTTI